MRSDAAWIGPLRQHGHAVAVQMRCDTVNRVRLAHARSRVPQGAGDEQAHAVFDQVHQLLDRRLHQGIAVPGLGEGLRRRHVDDRC